MVNFIRHYSQHYTSTLAFSSGLLALSSANFDNTALTPFIKRFGDCNAKGVCALNVTWLALFNSLIYVPFALGLFIGTWSQSRFGRRKTAMYMNIIPIVATTILLTSHNRWQLLVGRLIFYLYCGFELGLIPVYQAELVPRQVRGLAVGSYQLSYGVGGLAMSCIIKGTSTLNTDASWQIPYGLFYIVPVIVAIGAQFIPESPRWLLAQGRVEEAKETLKRIRVDKSDQALDQEIQDVLQALEAEKDKGRWSDLFRGVNRRRTAISTGTMFFNIATGQAFITSYGAIFIKKIGTINTFTMGVVNSIAAIVTLGSAMLTSDHVGRRFIFITGAVIQTAALFTMAGLGTVSPTNSAIGKGIVAMTTIYSIGYGYGSSAMNHVLTAEVPNARLRDKTSRVTGWVNNLTSFVVSYSLSYMINAPGNMGGKVGFVYGPISFISIFWGLFMIPECRGRSLEEIDELFNLKISAWRSTSWKPLPSSDTETDSEKA